MKKIIQHAIIAGTAVLMTQGAFAQSWFERRLPSLVSSGRVSVLELSAQQQEAFGLEAAKSRLAFLVNRRENTPLPRLERRIQRIAGELTAQFLAEISADEDFDRAEFRAVRSTPLRIRVADDIESVSVGPTASLAQFVTTVNAFIAEAAATVEPEPEQGPTLAERAAASGESPQITVIRERLAVTTDPAQVARLQEAIDRLLALQN